MKSKHYGERELQSHFRNSKYASKKKSMALDIPPVLLDQIHVQKHTKATDSVQER